MRDSGYEAWEKDLLAVAETTPDFIIDDGAELTIRMATHRPDLFAELSGVTEQTTTGVARLMALAERDMLPFPALAANDALCKHLFDNRYGTGQSTVQAILNLTNMLMAGKTVALLGYGWVGRGIAAHVGLLVAPHGWLRLIQSKRSRRSWMVTKSGISLRRCRWRIL